LAGQAEPLCSSKKQLLCPTGRGAGVGKGPTREPSGGYCTPP